MSRIGKKPIPIPEGVEVKAEDGKVTIKGPKGTLVQRIRPEIKVSLENNQITLSPQKETPKGKQASYGASKETRAFWGLGRALLANAIKGVTEGFEKKLEIEGVGYRASLEGEDLVLQVGFSHPVRVKAPEGIKFSLEKNVIAVSGIDRGLVGQMAAKVRAVKPPEPYKGKGIRYAGEQIRRKLGKKAVASAG